MKTLSNANLECKKERRTPLGRHLWCLDPLKRRCPKHWSRCKVETTNRLRSVVVVIKVVKEVNVLEMVVVVMIMR